MVVGRRSAGAGHTVGAAFMRASSSGARGWRRVAEVARIIRLLLEVAEHGARVDAEVARGLRAVAVIERENLVDVVALELILRVREREDLRQRVAGEPEIVGADHRRLAEDDRLLDAVLEL